MSPLGIDGVAWVGAASAVFVFGLAVAVLVLRRGEDDGLDREIEARLLLGEDPAEIDRDLNERAANHAPVTDHPLRDEPAT